jgi:myosin heavy subunit
MNEPVPKPENLTDESEKHHHPVLTGICVLLIAAVVGVVWYTMPALKRHDFSLRDLPHWSQTISSLEDRLKDIEGKVSSSSSDQQALRGEVAKLRESLREKLDAIGKEGGQTASDVYQKVQAQFEPALQAQSDGLKNVQERVSDLESSHASDRAEIARLQQQLSQVSDQTAQQAAQQSSEVAQIRRQVDENQSGASGQLADLKREQDRQKQDVEAIVDGIAVRKLPFEAAKSRQQDLGEGISLYVSGIDPSYRRYSGWMWVAEDRRNIWLHNQGAQQPVIFYGYQDGKKRELVITNVTQGSVTGYLVVPKQGAAPATPSAGE